MNVQVTNVQKSCDAIMLAWIRIIKEHLCHEALSENFYFYLVFNFYLVFYFNSILLPQQWFSVAVLMCWLASSQTFLLL